MAQREKASDIHFGAVNFDFEVYLLRGDDSNDKKLGQSALRKEWVSSRHDCSNLRYRSR